MKIAVYPGSFDPVTYGHQDIIERAAKLFDKLIVAVLHNNAKTPLFTVDERVKMLQDITKDYGNVEVAKFEGLTIDFVHKVGGHVIVRGLRATTDFEYELQMSQTNRVMSKDIDTVFLNTNLKYSYLSSSTVKEIAEFGGDIDAFVPAEVKRLTIQKMQQKEGKYEK